MCKMNASSFDPIQEMTDRKVNAIGRQSFSAPMRQRSCCPISPGALELTDDEMCSNDKYRQYDHGAQQENYDKVSNTDWQAGPQYYHSDF